MAGPAAGSSLTVMVLPEPNELWGQDVPERAEDAADETGDADDHAEHETSQAPTIQPMPGLIFALVRGPGGCRNRDRRGITVGGAVLVLLLAIWLLGNAVTGCARGCVTRRRTKSWDMCQIVVGAAWIAIAVDLTTAWSERTRLLLSHLAAGRRTLGTRRSRSARPGVRPLESRTTREVRVLEDRKLDGAARDRRGLRRHRRSRSAPRRWSSGTASASRRPRSATTWPRWRRRATSPSRTPAPAGSPPTRATGCSSTGSPRSSR